jgi:hypothetical protein
MANTYLTRTVASSSNRKTWTWSGWVKRSNVTGYQTLFSSYSDANNYTRILFWSSSSQQLTVSSKVAGSFPIDYRLSRRFRDTSAWYHIVVALDTTQATDTNRLKIYINGVLETAYEGSASSLPSQNEEPFINRNRVHYIGQTGDSSGYFDGLISHVHFCDGTALAPTVFGSTDSTTGEWKINTSPSFTLGTNGFTILKDGNTITDQSSNSNNWSLGGGTLTKTEDNPSNVFCTLNPLNGVQPTGGLNLATGNLTFADGENGSNYSYVAGTLGASSGKFYWETKVDDLAEIDQVGVALASASFSGLANSTGLQGTAYGGKGCQFSNGYKVGDGSGGAYMGAVSVNSIMMVALDLDNNKITFGRNGSWANGSGGADQTYANSTPAFTNLTAGEFYVPAQAKRAGGSNYGTNRYNFGNGYFGTTAVASAGTNASGIGIFEYDVPTGFTALSTKGLNL